MDAGSQSGFATAACQEQTPRGPHGHQGNQRRAPRESQAEAEAAMPQRSPSPLATDGEEEAFHTPIRSAPVDVPPPKLLPTA